MSLLCSYCFHFVRDDALAGGRDRTEADDWDGSLAASTYPLTGECRKSPCCRKTTFMLWRISTKFSRTIVFGITSQHRSFREIIKVKKSAAFHVTRTVWYNWPRTGSVVERKNRFLPRTDSGWVLVNVKSCINTHHVKSSWEMSSTGDVTQRECISLVFKTVRL